MLIMNKEMLLFTRPMYIKVQLHEGFMLALTYFYIVIGCVGNNFG